MGSNAGFDGILALLRRFRNGQDAALVGDRLMDGFVCEEAIVALRRRSMREDLSDLFNGFPDWEVAIRGTGALLYDDERALEYLFCVGLLLAEVCLAPFEPQNMDELELMVNTSDSPLDLEDGLGLLAEHYADGSTRSNVSRILSSPEALRQIGSILRENSCWVRQALSQARLLGQRLDEHLDEPPLLHEEYLAQVSPAALGGSLVASGAYMIPILIGMVGGGLSVR